MARKIGERHRWGWLAAAETAVIAAELCRYNWISAAVGSAAVLLFHWYMNRTVWEKGAAEQIAKIKVVGKALLIISMICFELLLVWAAVLAGKAFPASETSPLLGWILLGLAAWGSIKGAEACAACSGVLSLFLLALYGVVAVFSVPDVNAEYLQIRGDGKEILQCIGYLMPAAIVWYLPGKKDVHNRKWDIAALLLVGAGVLSLITSGVLSPELVREVTVPLYVVAQSVSLFGVVERIEPLLSAAMTMGIFAMLSVIANGFNAAGNQIRPWKYYGVVSCVLAGGLMLAVKETDALWPVLGSSGVGIILLIASIAAGKRKSNY